MKMPATVYTVLTEFSGGDIGAAGDVTVYREAAYDQFAECMADDQTATVLEISSDVETGKLESARDITDGILAEYVETCRDRGISLTETAADMSGTTVDSDSQCDDAYDMHRIAAE